jgi:lysophospholipase L1-like esterase
MHCPQKKAANQIEVINQINKRIERFCETTTDKYKFFNFDEFISDDAKWFIEDGLHLTEQAYDMLNTQLSPVLNKWVNGHIKNNDCA